MKRPRISFIGICLASLVAACGSGGSSGSSQGGSTSGNSSSGGSSGSSGGSTGSPGGSTSKSSGGSTGNVGGSSGNGGSTSTSKPGGSSGTLGGTSGNPGGTGGGSAGGSGGATTSAGGGGSATGGGAGGGSTSSGGGSTAGGATSSASTTPASTEPAVYISTNGSCVSGSGTTWAPGTITTSTGTATVTVDDSSQRQTWEGFGGCFNEKGWIYLKKLNEADRDRAMKLLFAKDGARFNIGRIPMGASDYADQRYTCDEGGEDTDMAKFNITQDKVNIIPFIQAALAVNPDIKFWASPWTPPTWMKVGPFTATTDDSATTKTNFDSGNMSDKDTVLAAYAKYFVKFIEAYKGENIKISMVAPQNEPGYALHYPSCLWTSQVYTKFVGQYLGPALKDSGVDIMLGTLSNADSGKDIDLANAAAADSTAKNFFKVLGVQWNVLDKLNTGTKIGSLPVWATEHKCGNYPWETATYKSDQAPNDQAYGVESWNYIRDAINKGQVTAYNAWNMVLDHVGNGIDTHRAWNQDTLLAVNTSSNALKVTPAYCVFRHFSQFVEPKATVLGGSNGDVVAFKNPDGTLVAVIYNSGAAKDNFVVSLGGKKLQFNMPASAWATVKAKP